jgi:hypothetical protein
MSMAKPCHRLDGKRRGLHPSRAYFFLYRRNRVHADSGVETAHLL